MPPTVTSSERTRRTRFLGAVTAHSLGPSCIDCLLITPFPLFSYFTRLSMVCIWSRALVHWFPGCVRAVPGILGYPWNILVRWNICHGYLMHHSPRVPRTPPRTFAICFFSVTHTLPSCALARCSFWYLGKTACKNTVGSA